MKQPKTNFDWSKWDSKWKWAAKDQDGSIFVYTILPVPYDMLWGNGFSLETQTKVSHSGVFIEGDWKESLISREEMEKVVPEKNRFKVGDKVKIVRKFESTSSCSWNTCMDKTIGMLGKVLEVGDFQSDALFYVETVGEQWYYPSAVLELVAEGSGINKATLTKDPSAFTEDNFKLFINSLGCTTSAGSVVNTYCMFKEWLSSRKSVNTNEQRAKGFLESKGWKVEKC